MSTNAATIKKSAGIISVTPAAALRIQHLIAKRGKPTKGIRIAVRTKGCSGLSYTIEYVDEVQKADEIVATHGVTLYIDPKAILFIIGTEMDYEDQIIQSGFTFRNPNEKGRCGCGESFTV